MNVAYVVVAAFVGALVAAVLGWITTEEPFNGRKFGASCLRALLAAAVFGATFSYVNQLHPIDILIAFLGGAGVDVIGHRVSGSIRS